MTEHIRKHENIRLKSDEKLIRSSFLALNWNKSIDEIKREFPALNLENYSVEEAGLTLGAFLINSQKDENIGFNQLKNLSIADRRLVIKNLKDAGIENLINEESLQWTPWEAVVAGGDKIMLDVEERKSEQVEETTSIVLEYIDKVVSGDMKKNRANIREKFPKGYPQKRLENVLERQNKNPQVAGVLEAISNSLDALSGSKVLGQFGMGVKQILTWLEPGTGEVKVITKSAEGKNFVFKARQGVDGQIYTKFEQAKDLDKEVFSEDKTGTIIKVEGINVSPEKQAELSNKIMEKRQYDQSSNITINSQPINKETDKDGQVDVNISDKRLSITDNGAGMDAKLFFKMFLPGHGKSYNPLSIEDAKDIAQNSAETSFYDDNKSQICLTGRGETNYTIAIPKDRINLYKGSLVLELGKIIKISKSREGFEFDENISVSLPIITQRILEDDNLSTDKKLQFINSLCLGLDEKLGDASEKAADKQAALIQSAKKGIRNISENFIKELIKSGCKLLPNLEVYQKLNLENINFIDPYLLKKIDNVSNYVPRIKGVTELKNSGIKTINGWKLLSAPLKESGELPNLDETVEERTKNILNLRKNLTRESPVIIDDKHKVAIIDEKVWHKINQDSDNKEIKDQYQQALIQTLVNEKIITSYEDDTDGILNILVNNETQPIGKFTAEKIGCNLSDREDNALIRALNSHNTKRLIHNDKLYYVKFPLMGIYDFKTGQVKEVRLKFLEDSFRSCISEIFFDKGLCIKLVDFHGDDGPVMRVNESGEILEKEEVGGEWIRGKTIGAKIYDNNSLEVYTDLENGDLLDIDLDEDLNRPADLHLLGDYLYNFGGRNHQEFQKFKVTASPEGREFEKKGSMIESGKFDDRFIKIVSLNGQLYGMQKEKSRIANIVIFRLELDPEVQEIKRLKNEKLFSEMKMIASKPFNGVVFDPEIYGDESSGSLVIVSKGETYKIKPEDEKIEWELVNTLPEVKGGVYSQEVSSLVSVFNEELGLQDSPMLVRGILTQLTTNYTNWENPEDPENPRYIEVEDVGQIIYKQIPNPDYVGEKINDEFTSDEDYKKNFKTDLNKLTALIKSEKVKNLLVDVTEDLGDNIDLKNNFLWNFQYLLGKNEDEISAELLELMMVSSDIRPFLALDSARFSSIMEKLKSLDTPNEKLGLLKMIEGAILKDESEEGIDLFFENLDRLFKHEDRKNRFITIIKTHVAQISESFQNYKELSISDPLRPYILFLTNKADFLEDKGSEKINLQDYTKILPENISVELLYYLRKIEGLNTEKEISNFITENDGLDALENKNINLNFPKDEIKKAIHTQSVEAGVDKREISQNCLDAIEKTGKSGTITWDSYIENGKTYVEEITDTGCGISNLISFIVPSISEKESDGSRGFFGSGLHKIFLENDQVEVKTIVEKGGKLKEVQALINVEKNIQGKSMGLKIGYSVEKDAEKDAKVGTKLKMKRDVNERLVELESMISKMTIMNMAGLTTNKEIAKQDVTWKFRNEKGELEDFALDATVMSEYTLSNGKSIQFVKCAELSPSISSGGLRMGNLVGNISNYLAETSGKESQLVLENYHVVIDSGIGLLEDRSAIMKESEILSEIQRIIATEELKITTKKLLTDPIFRTPDLPEDFYKSPLVIRALSSGTNKQAFNIAKNINNGGNLSVEDLEFLKGETNLIPHKLLLLINLEMKTDKGVDSLLRRIALIEEKTAKKESIKRDSLAEKFDFNMEETVVNEQFKKIVKQGVTAFLDKIERDKTREKIKQKDKKSIEDLANITAYERTVLLDFFKKFGFKEVYFIDPEKIGNLGSFNGLELWLSEGLLKGSMKERLDTIIHETAHLLESCMRGQDAGEILSHDDLEGTDLRLTHQQKGPFADGYKIASLYMQAVLDEAR